MQKATTTTLYQDRITFDWLILSSDEFVRIHLNFDFLNFKSKFRMSNLAKFEFCNQIRQNSTTNLTSNLSKFDNLGQFLVILMAF